MARGIQARRARQTRSDLAPIRAALRSLIHNSFDGMLLTDRSDRILEVNVAASRLFGQRASTLIGKPVRDLVNLRHRPVERRSGKSLENAHARTAIYTLERPDKSLVDVAVRDVPSALPTLRLRILRDVTSERSMSEALDAKTRLLEEAERVGQAGAWEMDVKTGLLLRTRELCRLMEVPPTSNTVTLEESYGFFTEPSRAIVREAFNATMKRGTPYDLELECLTGRGNRIWVREVCRATMHKGRLVSVIGITQDITERRRLDRLLGDIATRERASVGANLHDGLGQELTGLALLLKSAAVRAAHDGVSVSQELHELSSRASSAVATVRAMAHGILPVEFHVDGLLGALQRFARSTSRALGVLVSVRVRGSNRHLPGGAVAENLYRIAQEATTNAVRHGRAKRISLRVHANDMQTVLTASDDGVGIDLDRASQGMGLQIMRYRARLLGGLVDVRPLPKGGTRVRCIIPRSRVA